MDIQLILLYCMLLILGPLEKTLVQNKNLPLLKMELSKKRKHLDGFGLYM